MFSDLVGKPFKWGGRGPESFDCWGLVRFAFERATGIQVEDPIEYAKDPRCGSDLFDEHISDNWLDVSRGRLRDFDVLLFDYNGNGCASHSGLYYQGRVLQSGSKTGVINTPFMRIKKSLVKAYRHKCLA